MLGNKTGMLALGSHKPLRKHINVTTTPEALALHKMNDCTLCDCCFGFSETTNFVESMLIEDGVLCNLGVLAGFGVSGSLTLSLTFTLETICRTPHNVSKSLGRHCANVALGLDAFSFLWGLQQQLDQTVQAVVRFGTHRILGHAAALYSA